MGSRKSNLHKIVYSAIAGRPRVNAWWPTPTKRIPGYLDVGIFPWFHRYQKAPLRPDFQKRGMWIRSKRIRRDKGLRYGLGGISKSANLQSITCVSKAPELREGKKTPPRLENILRVKVNSRLFISPPRLTTGNAGGIWQGWDVSELARGFFEHGGLLAREWKLGRTRIKMLSLTTTFWFNSYSILSYVSNQSRGSAM